MYPKPCYADAELLRTKGMSPELKVQINVSMCSKGRALPLRLRGELLLDVFLLLSKLFGRDAEENNCIYY